MLGIASNLNNVFVAITFGDFVTSLISSAVGVITPPSFCEPFLFCTFIIYTPSMLYFKKKLVVSNKIILGVSYLGLGFAITL
jgi:hypothetical protein